MCYDTTLGGYSGCLHRMKRDSVVRAPQDSLPGEFLLMDDDKR